MLFNSAVFVVFFITVLLVYWRLSHRWQNYFLLAASMFFYGSWNVTLLPLIVFTATVNYFCGLWLVRHEHLKKPILALSVVVSLGLLAYFKYYNFFVDSLNTLLSAVGLGASIGTLQILLPVGISFYTFQTLSYTIDVYRKTLPPCNRYFDFVLYVSFFPQLVAGPIERAERLLPQVLTPRKRLKQATILDGVKLIIIGYFQKVAIADTISPFVDAIFRDPSGYSAVMTLVGIYGFTLQIYCDFSGYSKIARGTARLLGFDIMTNFKQPYFSKSPSEFWRRWHISLSSWLRDYLYIPLGGNRKGRLRTYVNLMLTMVLGGLWHGASWNFVIWGAVHGALLCIHKALPASWSSRASRLRQLGGMALTFNLVAFCWLFFRAENLNVVWRMIQNLTHPSGELSIELLTLILYGAMSMMLDLLLEKGRTRECRYMVSVTSRSWVTETAVFASIVVVTLFIGGSDAAPFLYFQF